MSLAIVTTSINASPIVYREWAQVGTLIVAGDHNSPPELEHYVKDIGGTYLSVEDQHKYPFSAAIGWRNIQRRNVAIMHAYERQFQYVLTVDDDNYPQQSAKQFIEGHMRALEAKPTTTFSSPTGHLNTGMFCLPEFHQRGVPYGVITHIIQPVNVDYDRAPRIAVSQAQVLGDPDCDAVERMLHAPDVKAVRMDATITPGVYAAFNSQATMWQGAWAPVMAVLPHIGRYDDIFASFLFHRLAREYYVALHVGTPVVVQRRNEHNLLKDLGAELWGMSRVFTFIDEINRAHISADMPLHVAYSELIVAAAAVLPQPTVSFAEAWIKYWKELL